ncbi:hypothetical protein MASR2M8_15900 [Opitutaceae bacterium]
MPQVSIITPLHNKGPYIDATVQSVLAQRMTDWELIIVENGSSDDGPRIASAYPDRDPRISYRVSVRRGPGTARNAGLEHATGEWVLFLDADDLIEPGYLEERLQTAKAETGTGIVAGPWVEFTDNRDAADRSNRVPAAYRQSQTDLVNTAIASAPWVLHAALIRRSLLVAGRTWPESLDRWPSEDAAFWFPLVATSSVAWASGNGATYRLATPTSRDRRDDVGRRTSGLLAVVTHNTAFLEQTGQRVTSQQAGTLVRVLERAYLDCLQAGQAALAATALEAANRWLSLAGAKSAGLLARRLLGIPLFNRLGGRLN